MELFRFNGVPCKLRPGLDYTVDSAARRQTVETIGNPVYRVRPSLDGLDPDGHGAKAAAQFHGIDKIRRSDNQYFYRSSRTVLYPPF